MCVTGVSSTFVRKVCVCRVAVGGVKKYVGRIRGTVHAS